MTLWKGDAVLATVISEIFARNLQWKSNFFLPNDSLLVICNKPYFGGVDTGELDDVTEEIAKKYNIGANELNFGARYFEEFLEILKIATLKIPIQS